MKKKETKQQNWDMRHITSIQLHNEINELMVRAIKNPVQSGAAVLSKAEISKFQQDLRNKDDQSQNNVDTQAEEELDRFYT